MYRETATKTPAATPHDVDCLPIRVVGELFSHPPGSGLAHVSPKLSGSRSVIARALDPDLWRLQLPRGPEGGFAGRQKTWAGQPRTRGHTTPPCAPPHTYIQSPEQTWSTTWAGLPSQHSRATEKVLGEVGRGRPPCEDDGLSVTLQPTQHNTGGRQHSFKDLSRVALPPQTMCPSPNLQHLRMRPHLEKIFPM